MVVKVGFTVTHGHGDQRLLLGILCQRLPIFVAVTFKSCLTVTAGQAGRVSPEAAGTPGSDSDSDLQAGHGAHPGRDGNDHRDQRGVRSGDSDSCEASRRILCVCLRLTRTRIEGRVRDFKLDDSKPSQGSSSESTTTGSVKDKPVTARSKTAGATGSKTRL